MNTKVKRRFGFFFFKERNELSDSLLVFTNVKMRFGVFQKLSAQRERVAEWNDAVVKSKKANETSALDNVWTCRRRHVTFVHWDFNADASTQTPKSIMEYVVNMKIRNALSCWRKV